MSADKNVSLPGQREWLRELGRPRLRAGVWPRNKAAELLTVAAQRLRAEYPDRRRAVFVSTLNGGPCEYLARFDWPGVVTVFQRCNGRRIVESKPGEPFTVGTWCSEGDPFAELP